MNPLSKRLSAILYGIRQRCTNPARPGWKRYGKRGIAARLTLADMLKLWKRDAAHLLSRPCVDRIDNDGHYEFSNCRFIELSENCRKRWEDAHAGFRTFNAAFTDDDFPATPIPEPVSNLPAI